ncbi:MAG: uncharacterized protein JWN61_196, partial [Pseudonocardiales bacterium]|nr:uncharacterized protein [Pseudonocardiales bacterium]
LSLVEGRFRLPIGSSGGAAALAEALQFTHGEGPCLDAGRTGAIAGYSLQDIERRWPAFALELAARTPYRAILSLPLPLGPAASAAMDLYLVDPGALTAVSLSEAAAAAAEVVGALMADAALSRWLSPDADTAEPAWMDSAAASGRSKVWIAIGMLMKDTKESASDLLARLRAYAYAQGSTLDDVSAAIVAGALPVGAIAPDAP